MKELAEKLKRNIPLVRIRKAQLDKENLTLMNIRQSKLAAINSLKEYQRQYIEGVEKLNRLRLAGELGQLMNLESSIDYVKGKWYSSLKEVRRIEEDEKAQVKVVLDAQQKLKTMEILGDRYRFEIIESERKADQKNMDEIAIQRHQYKAS